MAWNPFRKRQTDEALPTPFDDRTPTRPDINSPFNRLNAFTDPNADRRTKPGGFPLVDTIAKELATAEKEKRQKAITAPEGHTTITNVDIVSSESTEKASIPKDFGEGAGIVRRPTEPKIPTIPSPTPDAAIFRRGKK